MENIRVLTDFENWDKDEISYKLYKQDNKGTIKVVKGLKHYLSAIFTHKIESYINKEVYLSALE